jgi:hypothetical protein
LLLLYNVLVQEGIRARRLDAVKYLTEDFSGRWIRILSERRKNPMKNFALLLAALALTSSAFAGTTTTTKKKATRAPADVLGTAQYNYGIITILGPAADAIYAAMTTLSPVGGNAEKSGNGIVCRKDDVGNNLCIINFDGNVANGVLEHDCGPRPTPSAAQ